MSYFIKLIDGNQYEVTRTDIVDHKLEIDITASADVTTESMQTIFQNASNLSRIVLVQNDAEFGEFNNWTEYAGCLLKGETITVYLLQPVDEVEQRVATLESKIASVESNAETALSTAQTSQNTSSDALTSANTALDTANAATETAKEALAAVSTLQTENEELITKANEAIASVNNLQTALAAIKSE